MKNKKYPYVLAKLDKNKTHVRCDAAGIDQDFLNEDIPALLIDLPNLILSETEYKKTQDQMIRFRITTAEKEIIEKKAVNKGYSTVSSFLRDLALNA